MDEMEKMTALLGLLAVTAKMKDVARLINNGDKENAISALKSINEALDMLEEALDD